MARLPSPIAFPIPDKTGQSEGKPVQTELELTSAKILPYTEETNDLADAVPTWEALKMAEREGFEP
jgi:hypothetical protein